MKITLNLQINLRTSDIWILRLSIHEQEIFFYLFKSWWLYLWRLMCLLSWVGNSSCVYSVIPKAIYYFTWHTHQSTYSELGTQAYIYVS